MDWFQRLTGFRETADRVRSDLIVVDDCLHSRANGLSYGIGKLEVISLGELRSRVHSLVHAPGKILVSTVSGDVRALHRDPHYRHALFQVASQFNLLEMPSEDVTPERGVTGYAWDRTQGPACAIAAGAATIYRNYFVQVGESIGQSKDCQIDCLADMGVALGNVDNRLWTMRNGYALCSLEGLGEIEHSLAHMSEVGRGDLRARLRIGVQWNVEVTDGVAPGTQHVTQAFCSALPVAYGDEPPRAWAAFATLVLEASYEATLWAAVLNARRFGSNQVLLTRVGGGVFGNDQAWIQHAMSRALSLVRDRDFDVRLVCYGPPDADQVALVGAFR